jgi:short-subunit dehydrogenase
VEKKTCLITGATEGVGKATAMKLARAGFTVVMAARNEEKAKVVKQEIVSLSGNADVAYITADLKSLKQIYELAETFPVGASILRLPGGGSGSLRLPRVLR